MSIVPEQIQRRHMTVLSYVGVNGVPHNKVGHEKNVVRFKNARRDGSCKICPVYDLRNHSQSRNRDRLQKLRMKEQTALKYHYGLRRTHVQLN